MEEIEIFIHMPLKDKIKIIKSIALHLSLLGITYFGVVVYLPKILTK